MRHYLGVNESVGIDGMSILIAAGFVLGVLSVQAAARLRPVRAEAVARHRTR